MKIVSLIEATTMNAVAKGTLEFYRTARELSGAGESSIEGAVITFDRAADQAHPNEFIRTFRDFGIKVEIIPERRRFDLSVIPALRNFVEAFHPDIVVTHSVKSHFLMWRSRLWKEYPWVALHHGYTTTDRKMRVYNRLDRWSLPKADRVLTVCHAFAQELANITGISVEEISVRHNAIRPSPPPDSTEIESLRERYGLAENDRVILSIGRLSKEKGHRDLISAFIHLCDTNPETKARLMIVGDGPERESLQAAAKITSVNERVIFAGQVSNVQPFYAIADVFVLPSHSEGSPNVLLEAMAANVPVVATAVGGVPEIVANDASALLVPANDPAALAGAIDRLLADQELGKRLTQTAAALIKSDHSPEQHAEALIAIYREEINRRRVST